MHESLTVYLARYLHDPKELERALVMPVLLYEPPEEAAAREVPERLFNTVSGVSGPAAIGGGEPVILKVRKAKDNAFQRGITVGRTANNDVVIDDGSVSRFHAWFQQDALTGDWSLADAGSKNGTHLAGLKLKPRKLSALSRESRLRFGKVDVTFLTPPAFLRLLKLRSGS